MVNVLGALVIVLMILVGVMVFPMVRRTFFPHNGGQLKTVFWSHSFQHGSDLEYKWDLSDMKLMAEVYVTNAGDRPFMIQWINVQFRNAEGKKITMTFKTPELEGPLLLEPDRTVHKSLVITRGPAGVTHLSTTVNIQYFDGSNDQLEADSDFETHSGSGPAKWKNRF